MHIQTYSMLIQNTVWQELLHLNHEGWLCSSMRLHDKIVQLHQILNVHRETSFFCIEQNLAPP